MSGPLFYTIYFLQMCIYKNVRQGQWLKFAYTKLSINTFFCSRFKEFFNLKCAFSGHPANVLIKH